jgi:hypothetical protein
MKKYDPKKDYTMWVVAGLGILLLVWMWNNGTKSLKLWEESMKAACSYEITPEQSGLTPSVDVNLKDGETMDLTFGELKKFHAECQQGFVRYWIVEIDQFCVRESITLLTDGTWYCTLDVNGMEGMGFYMGGLWTTPIGEPPGGWSNPETNPLMTPVPQLPSGSVSG